MAIVRVYVYADELEEKLNNFKQEGSEIISVIPYDGWLMQGKNPLLSDVKRGYEIILDEQN